MLMHRPLNEVTIHSPGPDTPVSSRNDGAGRDSALAGWVTTSLLGMALGCALAKHGQAWARDVWHPAAVWGALIVVASMLLALVAGLRFLASGPTSPGQGRSDRALFTLATVVVVALGWAALAVIFFAGWELPLRGER